VCYERCPYNPTAATFLLSAIWHGLYPGYYLTFVTGIAVTMAARAVSILYMRWAVKARLKVRNISQRFYLMNNWNADFYI